MIARRSGPNRFPAVLLAAALCGLAVPAEPASAQGVRAGAAEHGGPEGYRDPAASRLFFAPTGRTLAGGEKQLGTYMILPFGTYAFTDRVMVSAGTPFVPDAIGRFWYVAPKLGLYSGDGVDVAIGGLLIGFVHIDHSATLGSLDLETTSPIFWLVGTLGTEDRSVSGGVATSSAGPWRSRWNPVRSRTLFFGGELLIDRRLAEPGTVDRAAKLIGEVYAPWTGIVGGVFSSTVGAIGIRFMNGRTSVEVVGVGAPGQDRFIPAPLLSLSHRL